MLNRSQKTFLLWFALLFGCGIAVLSVIPINRVAMGTRPRFAASASAIHHAAMWHTTVHVLIFGVAALVAWFATELAADGTTHKFIAILVTLLLGCTTEWLQHEVYQQPLEINDVFTNVTASSAVFLILIIVSLARKRWRKLEPDNNFILRDLN